jgi:hypothetical protein
MEKLTDQLTPEENAGYEAKAVEISKKLGVSKVYPYVGIDPDTKERIVGFIKEPNYLQKIFAMDKIATVGMFMAGEELRSVLTIEDESDPRTYSTASDCDRFRLAMASICVTIIEVVQNSFKKK